MMPQSGSPRLSKALADEERRALQEKIDRALCSFDDPSRNIVRLESDEQERKKRMESGLAQAGMGAKVNVWMRGFLNAKSGEVLYAEAKLAALRSQIASAAPAMVNFSSGELAPAFASRVYDLYRRLMELRPVFHAAFMDRERVENLVMSVLTRRRPELKTRLFDLMTVEEMRSLYMNGESKTELIGEAVRRIDDHLETITEGSFADLPAAIEPLYHYRNLVLYPYDELFAMFGYEPASAEPVFRPCSAGACADQLDRLFYALYPFAKMPNSTFRVDETALRSFLVVSSAGYGTADDLDASLVDGLRRELSALLDAVREFLRIVPLTALVRFVHGDPFYRLLLYSPRLRLHAFHAAALRLHALDELDRVFPGLRLGIVDELIERLFGGDGLKEFEFFKSSTPLIVSKLGLPSFIHIRSLTVVYNFILDHYYGYIQEIVHVLNRLVPVHYREELGSMFLFAAGIEDLLDTLKRLDYGFSPESNDGKIFYRMRYALEKEILQQKNYRQFVTQKNRECRAMLDKGLEQFNGLVRVFRAILSDSRIPLHKHHVNFRRSEFGHFKDAVEHGVGALTAVMKIVRQLLLIEEGS